MRVTASEFYKRPGYYFDLVAAGLSLEITRHGRVISRLEPPKDRPLPGFEPRIPKVTPAGTGFRFGAFTFGGVWQGMQAFEALENLLSVRLAIAHWFMNFEHGWDASLVELASSQGRLALLSWEAQSIALEDISSGRYDAYLTAWAQGAKAFAKPLYLRPFPEMNGNWTSWHGKPEVLKTAWQYMVRLFRFHEASNVHWVWCPNCSDEPRTAENAMERYYPGAEFVDILALDGYNWGTSRPWSSWQSFEDIFAEPYARISRLGSQAIWIAETACAEQPGFDKAAWIREMFACQAFPRLEAVIWFHQQKEADWRMDSSSAAVAAFQQELSQLMLAGRAQPLA